MKPFNKGTILVVDDEKNILLVIQAILERAGYQPLTCQESSKAFDLIEEREIHAVITDLNMPGKGGMEILEYCQANHPRLPVVIITAFGTVEAAVTALKSGAFDFITKPFDQSELLNVMDKAVRTQRQREKEPAPAASISSIIGSSPQIVEIFKLIGKIAASPSTVLIRGESGTGKELVAYEIHKNSLRSKKSFIKINCAAIPATLIESELFGYEKGAFTGAVTSKPGRFELAHEGTLFLDEVAEMPLEMQVKLLRVLQEQEFERVGGVTSTRVDVRIITATNKDLEAEVKAGRFREDLYYRLNVVPILLPPLRDRKEDMDLLVNYFVQQFNEKLQKQISGVTPRCMEAFRVYGWPGNIRQLENILERMSLMSDSTVLDLHDLPEELAPKGSFNYSNESSSSDSADFKQIVRKQTQSIERDLIEKALEETTGNVTRAAEKLGLSRKGLQLKIKELGIKRPMD